ncbi:cytochrome bc complex cytochrome b subunit [Pseudidiomarina sp. 1APP75-32.1]|uniref:Cytochrome b n=2 Tax=Pseudidiomarina terrestris TaxID=2820060 RepID=A0AAW7R107_9GAMM|nr:cytochrome bc complex cytochrome b subunit [Pseudidiomarina sp. 1APP75-32.1]MDN7124315.1 cytochrome bc complex cytochrome b subunit [Pseudidiomarina sp. 1APP75-32.1]
MMKRLVAWIDERIPMTKTWNIHLAQYPAPKNFNFWYLFGVLAMLVLVNQILTGIWLTMNYEPSAEGAFRSVEYIMRDIDYGWLLRYMHSTGASAFFVVVYLHMLRGMMYGSYQKPRELLWVFGMLIFLVLMAEAFMGYLLPWGQMSYWGAQVIISLFGAIPVIGDDLTLWIRGDYVISGATLNRFFALHVIALPLVLVILVFLHIVALHEVGSNNPEGINIKKPKGSIPEEEKPKFKFHERFTKKYDIVDAFPFFPYYVVKDLVGIGIFLFLFCYVIFFAPAMGGLFLEPPNFEAANPLKTPDHIAPVWYFTPFYAILRAVPDKLLGVILMFGSIAALFVLPWLDRGKVRSIRYRSGFHKVNLAVFVVSFVALGYLGLKPATEVYTLFARIFTFLYFAFFVLLFFYSKNENTKPVPERITK